MCARIAVPSLVLLVLCGLLAAQVTRPKDVRELAKGGSNAIPQLQALLKNPDLPIRVEAVKSIVEIGTQRSLDPDSRHRWPREFLSARLRQDRYRRELRTRGPGNQGQVHRHQRPGD